MHARGLLLRFTAPSSRKLTEDGLSTTLEALGPEKTQATAGVKEMMPVSLSVGQRILLVLALVMLLWYVIGTWYSRRVGIRALNWIREGISGLGGQVQASWIGSAASGAAIAVSQPDPPFRQWEITFLLESRELLPLWLVNLLRGRRDKLIIKAHLRSSRKGELEVVPRGSQLERSLRQEGQPSWQWEDSLHGLCVAYRGDQGEALGAAVVPFLQSYGHSLRRFSWRQAKPHLLLHFRLAGLIDSPAADFFNDLSDIFAHP
jgi:hypothetical protein